MSPAMAEIIRRHDLGLPHPCPEGGHESHMNEEQREAAAWQRAAMSDQPCCMARTCDKCRGIKR